MTEHLTEERVRAFALSLPEAAESSHHGTPDFRVRNKIFATLPPAGGAVNVKCRPEDVDALVRLDPESFRDAWGVRWLGIDLGRVEAERVRELIVDAWRLAAPRALVRAFDAEREA